VNRKQRREAERAQHKAMKRVVAHDVNDETTPMAITPEILAFCQDLDATQTPTFVDVLPIPGAITMLLFFRMAKNSRSG